MTDDPAAEQRPPTRRTVLAGAGALAGVAALAACAPTSSKGSGTSTPGGPLAKLADIPVGGAVPASEPDGSPILVAQPRPGEAVAFSAICTHLGCTVAPAGTKLQCPCHGSVYDVGTGKVLRGPAPRALAPVPVHVVDGAVLLGRA